MMCDVLSAVAEGMGRPTKIMYHANLTWKTSHETLLELLRMGMISDYGREPHSYYVITPRGISLLRDYGLVRTSLGFRWSGLTTVEGG